MSYFEDLSNELFYEIFEYLDYFHIYQTFSNLNQRFDNLVFNSNFPIKIHLSLISKSTFKHYNKSIIQANIHRIAALHCSNVVMYEYIFLSIRQLKAFHRLETLILYNIQSKYLENLLNQLYTLPFLSSLILTSTDAIENKNILYRQVFRLPVLKYCKLSLFGQDTEEPLAACTDNEYSLIEYLVIVNNVYYDRLDRLLSYVPHLRRLSLHALEEPRNAQENIHRNFLNYVTHLFIKTTSLWFDHLTQLMSNFFQNIQVLHLTIQSYYMNEPCVDPKRWQQLIENHLPNLRVFDIYINTCIIDTNDQSNIEIYMNQFLRPFWIERQWFFTHHFYQEDNKNRLLVYSTNPYKRKSYILCGQVYKSNFNSIQHIDIKNEQSMDDHKHYFPNASQVTFSHISFRPSSSICAKLNRIIRLKHLTKLVIKCHHFPFREILRVLRYTPNLHTLELKAITYDPEKNECEFIVQHAHFRLVSQINNIRNITCTDECTLEQIQLLVTLCPRMHDLTINPRTEDFETIIRFLLDKNNSKTRHLCSLRFSGDYHFNTVNILIKSKRLLDDYTLIRAGLYFCLWW